ncbi:MAG: hypothetical protein DLM68_00365 [Hyphomicrobiales bacterium]|nr:MAG: hypothetical protein DLM68_00365 [Hyphomicrobiales bacterium]
MTGQGLQGTRPLPRTLKSKQRCTGFQGETFFWKTIFMMTDAERREKARLRSERWRRAHGIGPRRPAQRPWLAAGVSRSTWYRRRRQAQQAAAVASTRAALDRAEAFAAALTRDLARCAALERETMAIIAELAAVHSVALTRSSLNG